MTSFTKFETKPKKFFNEVINSHLSFTMDTFLSSLFVLHPLGTIILLADNKITIIFITKINKFKINIYMNSNVVQM
jgi:hypothetical protein